jgi:hypothetical protein
MGGETVGVKVLVVVSGGSVSVEVAVGLVLRSVLVAELQAAAKNSSNVTRRMDNDLCCFISNSISKSGWVKPGG